MTTFKDVMLEDEKIQWTSAKNTKLIFVRSFLGFFVLFTIIQLLFGVGGVTCKINGVSTVCHPEKYASLIYMIAFITGVWSFFSNKTVRYYATNKRIVIESGLIGRDFLSIYFDRILSADIDVGLIDKIFGTGTILIDTGKITTSKNGSSSACDPISGIDQPYVVYKKIQETLGKYKDRPREAVTGAAK